MLEVKKQTLQRLLIGRDVRWLPEHGAYRVKRRVGTNARLWITSSRHMACVLCSADDGVRADARTGLAGVGLSTRVAVVARGAICCHWIGATSRKHKRGS
jgi:hypothetical protein